MIGEPGHAQHFWQLQAVASVKDRSERHDERYILYLEHISLLAAAGDSGTLQVVATKSHTTAASRGDINFVNLTWIFSSPALT